MNPKPRPAPAPSSPPFGYGDLLCPLCGEPLDLITEQTDCGAEQVGRCAHCLAIVEIN